MVEGYPWHVDRNGLVLVTFHFLVDFLENEIVGFDENLTVSL